MNWVLRGGLFFGLMVSLLVPTSAEAGIFDRIFGKRAPPVTPSPGPSSTPGVTSPKTPGVFPGPGVSPAAPVNKAKPAAKKTANSKPKQSCSYQTVVVKRRKARKRVCTAVATNGSSPLAPAPPPPVRRVKGKNPDLRYGVVLHPLSQATPPELVLDSQLDLIHELGIAYVKTDYIGKLGDSWNDYLVNRLVAHNLKPIMIFDWQLIELPIDKLPVETIETEAYARARTVADRYKGKVAYWQVSAELANLSLKSPTHMGIDPSDYTDDGYVRTRNFVKGALRGIRDGDPNVSRMIVDQYLHVGFLDRLKADSVTDFEAIGWDLYSDVSTNLDNILLPTRDGYYDVLGKLIGTFPGKEIWLAEASRRDGTTDGNELATAQYLQQVFRYADQTPEVRGVLAYELLDQPEVPGTQANYGLVRLVKQEANNIVYRIGEKKAAFRALAGMASTGVPEVNY